MRDAVKAYLTLAASLTDLTRQRATAVARTVLSSSGSTAEQVAALADDLVQQSRANREAVTALVKFEVERALGRVGLASADEVADLSARVRALEAALRAVAQAAPAGSPPPAGPVADA